MSHIVFIILIIGDMPLHSLTLRQFVIAIFIFIWFDQSCSIGMIHFLRLDHLQLTVKYNLILVCQSNFGVPNVQQENYDSTLPKMLVSVENGMVLKCKKQKKHTIRQTNPHQLACKYIYPYDITFCRAQKIRDNLETPFYDVYRFVNENFRLRSFNFFLNLKHFHLLINLYLLDSKLFVLLWHFFKGVEIQHCFLKNIVLLPCSLSC